MFIPSLLGRVRIFRGLASGMQRVSQASREQVRSHLRRKNPAVVYYDKSAIRSLFKHTPFFALAAKRPLP